MAKPKPLQLVWGQPHEVIRIWPGGWGRCNVPDLGDHASTELYVRIEQDEAGRFFFAQVLVEDPAGVGARIMRDLPLGRIQAALANPAKAEAIAELVRTPGPGPAEIPYEYEDFGVQRRRQRRDAPAVIAVPEGTRKPDSFYVDVAVAFSELAGRSKQPAGELAEANAVPVTTVHRWVKEARRRGLMAPARASSDR